MRRSPVSQRLAVQRARATRRKEPARPIARIRSNSSAASNVSRVQKEPGKLGRFAASINWSKVRLVSVGIFFALLGTVLWLRAGYVQLVDGPRLAEMARRQHVRTEVLAGRRGDIVDRNGLVLASTLESSSVYVRPQEVQDPDESARILSAILQMPQNSVRKLLTEQKNFVWIARKIGDRTAAAVSEAGLRGIYLTTEYERIYPYREMAGQLLGFVGVDGQGLEGIEKAYDTQLSASTVKITVERDGSGRRFYPSAAAVPGQLDGHQVRLTIDMQIQHIAEQGIAAAVQKYNAKWGGCIVVDVPTGQVLAWAQYPFFNPNAYADYQPYEWRNRLAMDALEPGSTLKPLIVAAALEEGVSTPDTVFNCEKGRWKFAGTTIRDTSPREELTLTEVVRYSSNIGMAKLGLEMGPRLSWAYLARLGFGSRTGLPIGEGKGILRDPAQWAEIDTASTAFGQSLSVTGAQMVKAYLALASRGMAKPLHIVVNEAAAQQEAPQRVFSEEVSNQVLDILLETIQGEGSRSRARIPGVLVGGKTGTAQKADESGTYGDGRLASFVGIVPINEPRLLVFTMVDEPQGEVYGSVIAAPVFQQVTSRILAYQGMLPDPNAPAPLPVAVVQPTEQADAQATEQAGTPAEEAQSVAENTPAAPISPVATPVSTVVSAPLGGASRVNTPVYPSTPTGVVPDVVGQSVRRAVEIMAQSGVVPQIVGAGPVVVQQEPPAGSRWDAQANQSVNQSADESAGGGTPPCILWLSEQS